MIFSRVQKRIRTHIEEGIHNEIFEFLVQVDTEIRTNAESVFAAGNIVLVYQPAFVATVRAALAVHKAYKYIRKPYWS